MVKKVVCCALTVSRMDNTENASPLDDVPGSSNMPNALMRYLLWHCVPRNQVRVITDMRFCIVSCDIVKGVASYKELILQRAIRGRVDNDALLRELRAIVNINRFVKSNEQLCSIDEKMHFVLMEFKS